MTRGKQMKQIMIDPPSGWKYGFPKPLPDGVENIKAWLIEEGYPQAEIDLCGKHFYYRTWEQADDKSKTRTYI